MYSLLKGYVVRKPDDEDNDVIKPLGEGGNQAVLPQSSENSPQGSSYGRLISWSLDGVSYFGGQVKQRVGKSLLWISSEAVDPIEEKSFDMATRPPKRRLKMPEGAVEYSVQGNDTLSKIALQYDTTPSELTRMNRLTSRMLFPGQVLFVPDKKSSEPKPVDVPICTTTPEHLSGSSRGHEKIKLTKAVSLASDEEEEITESFLKVKTKYITDGQGVVSGVLLVTPHSVMFSPNVSDPLVMDRGRDSYCIKTPMSAITSAALYKDIAAMAIHNPLKSGRFYLGELTKDSISRENSIEVDLSNTGSSPSMHIDVAIDHAQGSTKRTVDEMANNEPHVSSTRRQTTGKSLKEPLSSSIIDRGGEGRQQQTTRVSEHDKLIQIANELLNDLITDVVDVVCDGEKPRGISVDNSQNCASLSPMSEDSGISSPRTKWKDNFKGTSCSIDDGAPEKGPDAYNGPNQGSLEPSHEGPSTDNCDHDMSHDSIMDNTSTESPSKTQRSSSFLSSLSGEVKYWLGLGYRNQDEQTKEKEIVPRPASTCDDQMLYLCIRISKEHWCMCLAGEGARVGKGEDLVNRDRRRREYWFAIPTSRVDHVYRFFKLYCPNINRTLSASEEELEDDDQPLDDDEEEAIQYVDGFYGCTPPNSLKIGTTLMTVGKSLSLDLTRKSTSHESLRTPDSFSDDSVFLPEMSAESQILSETLLKKLNKNLPSRTVGHIWTLVYSTFIHGFSLKTLYRNMENFDTPMLVVVQDDDHQMFGAVASCPLRISEGFYGTGQSFLFKFENESIKTFHWQGDNSFFMKGSVDCIAFGSGGGHFGLWLDEDFYHGSSNFSETYHNETLSKHEDFLCSALEAWTFM